MSFDDGEVFFDDDYVKPGKGKLKKKEDQFEDELPPPYPPTRLREKKRKDVKESEEKVDPELERALSHIVLRLTVYGEKRGNPKSKSKEKQTEKTKESNELPRKPQKVFVDDDEEKEEEPPEVGQVNKKQTGVEKEEETGMGETAQLRAALNDFLLRLDTLGVSKDLEGGSTEKLEEEIDDAQWEPVEEEEEVVTKKRGSILDEEFTMRKSGYSPLSHKEDGAAFKDLSDRVRAFYLKFDRVKLIEGIGHIVEWTLENGEESLNKRLYTKYGADLNTVEEVSKKTVEEKAKAEWGTKKKSPEGAKERQDSDEGESAGEHAGLSPQQKDKLIGLLKKHEATNLERRIYKAVKYAKQHGVADLNRRLLDRYGENLEKSAKPSKVVDLNDFGVRMLHLFYSKYDPVFIEKGGLEQVRIWTKRNGIHALDRKLKKKYKESLMDFSNRATELEEALNKFYKLVDAKRSKKDVDQVVTWGLINGVAAVNSNLQKKYGRDLRDVDGQEWTKQVPNIS